MRHGERRIFRMMLVLLYVDEVTFKRLGDSKKTQKKRCHDDRTDMFFVHQHTRDECSLSIHCKTFKHFFQNIVTSAWKKYVMRFGA